MKMFLQNNKRKGFTMIELMVVIAIIAVLLMLVAPKLLGNTDKAKTRVFEGNFRTLVSEVTMAYAEAKNTGRYNEVAAHATKMKDKPVEGVEYKVAAGTATAPGTGILKAKYGSYILQFDPATAEITVAGADASKGATYETTTGNLPTW